MSIYSFTINNSITQVRASNLYNALNFIKSLPAYRQMTLSEQMAVKVNRVSSWGALLSTKKT